jgi:dihydroneopterin aldolase
MNDIIRLCGLPFYGYHGVTAAEKETGRLFEIDCELELDLARPGKSDRLADTVNYHRVYSVIKETVEGTAFSLLEGLANHITSVILEKFNVERVTLKVRKMHPPINGHVKYIEVEITRCKGDN